MNSVDDPITLKDGEVARLVNLFPGDPPVARNGCNGVYKAFISGKDEFVKPGICYGFRGDTTIYGVSWVYSKTFDTYYLTIFNPNGSTDITNLGAATVTDPMFGFLQLHSSIYAFVNKDLTTWKADTKAIVNKVIESATIVRDMCISIAGSVTSATKVTSGGHFTLDKYVDYAFQYVRRNDAPAFTAGTTPTGMILPPGITGVPKRIDTFLPGMCVGIENPDNRKGVGPFAANDKVTITFTGDTSAIAQGATHLRVSRTLEFDSASLASEATHFFLCDLPVLTTSAAYDDTTSNAALTGEVNQLLTGYSVAPNAAYAKYHKGRLFLVADNGKVYYSEAVGKDGAYDLETAEEYPMLWASLFKPLSYYNKCDYEDGVAGTGVEVLQNDIYFFKESKIFALFGGDPTATAETLLSDSIGCLFPHTIVKCQIQGFGDCIFFMSNEGPAVITQGGNITLFSDFKVRELWPKLISPQRKGALGIVEVPKYDLASRDMAAFYYNNTVWVVNKEIVTNQTKMWGFYTNPLNPGARGALEIQLAIDGMLSTNIIIDKINLKAYLLGNNNKYTNMPLFLVEFLRAGTFEDLDSMQDYLTVTTFEFEQKNIELEGKNIEIQKVTL